MRGSVARAHKVLALLFLLLTTPYLSSYQVSFSFLQCYLKIDKNLSDILYML
jgi:hypothetical protein